MELHGLQERYDAIMVLRAEGLSNGKIGHKIGLSRAAVQRMVWLSQLPTYVKNAYLAGGFADGKIYGIWRLREDPAAVAEAFLALGAYRRRRICRTETEIRRAIAHAENSVVVRTLLWMVGECGTLPAV